MSQEADFCGDRLRLSAFLRVVADGMPQRPTRFKRRFIGIEQSLDSQKRRDADHGGAARSLSQEAILEGYPNDTIISDVARSLWPRSPEFAPDHIRSATRPSDELQKNCKQSEAVQPLQDQQHTREQEMTTALFEPLHVSRRTSGTPRRRHLPVNEVALLRTTSYDGLPLPSVRTCPTRQVYLAITDTQMLGCRSPLCCSYSCSRSYRRWPDSISHPFQCFIW